MVTGKDGVGYENVYEMYVRNGRLGFFVKRDSWSHPRTVARVVAIEGASEGKLTGKPPYYGGPKVIAQIAYQGRITRQPLSCPGTYAYRKVPQPDWWQDVPST